MKPSILTPVADWQTAHQPIQTVRLPRSGERDPHFGLSRAFYYQAETEGLIRLIRIRKRGNLRGITLVPFSEVAQLVKDSAADCPPSA